MFPPIKYPIEGIEVRQSLFLAERIQVRFPRSKKRRIRNKWRKDDRNWQNVGMDRCILVDNVLHIHPSKMQQLVDELAGKVRRRLEVLVLGDVHRGFLNTSIEPAPFGPSPLSPVSAIRDVVAAMEACLRPWKPITPLACITG